MLSIPHIIVIFIVALVVFGPEKLPELARNLGKVMAEFRRHTSDLRSTFEGHLRDLEREADSRKIAGPQPVRSVPSPAAPQSTASESTTPVPNPAPGTVPSDPPNAAAINAAPADAAAATSESASGPAPRKYPDDDPLLRELAESEFGPAASQHHEPSEPEKVSERVTDGDIPPA
jgi:sec-independent protein translocase protein TatB